MLERLSEIDRQYIKSKVESGHYTSEIELVRDAIRRMREEEEKRQQLESFRELIRLGQEQILNGEVVPYGTEFSKSVMEAAVRNHTQGKQVKDAVKP